MFLARSVSDSSSSPIFRLPADSSSIILVSIFTSFSEMDSPLGACPDTTLCRTCVCVVVVVAVVVGAQVSLIDHAKRDSV